MADGMTSLTALSYGTSTGGAAGTGETTNSLGVDRTDTRVPVDLAHIWAAQINACKNLLLLMTADSKGGTRLLVREQGSNPFGVTESGFYMDTSGNAYKVHNGTPTALSAGSAFTGGPVTSFVTYSGSSASTIAPSWVTPTLLNSWVWYGSFTTPQYTKDATGRVTLKGVLKLGTAANAVMFTLPAGFRPGQNSLFTTNTGNTGIATCIEVDTTGNVFAVSGGSTSATGLDGITFFAEN